MQLRGSKKNMPKAQLVSKFEFNWIKGHKKCFEFHGWELVWEKEPVFDKSVDLYLLMWLDRENYDFVMKYDVTNIMFMRRYEYYSDLVETLDWSRVNQAVVLNHYYRDGLLRRAGVNAEIIYNGVDLNDWTYKKRSHGTKIACVGIINYKKNFPLAYQILAKFPKEYSLHIAGKYNDFEFMLYIEHIAHSIGNHHIYLDGNIDDIDSWLEDKDYILSTSLSEGCPNNVIEAMAKGIKPVIHRWPGAKRMFGDYTFHTVDEAVGMMCPNSSYDSAAYYNKVEREFGPECYEQLFWLAKDVI